MVSWKPLTLSEARGFITFYTIEYYPSPNNKKRQAPSDIMRVNVSADSSSAIIDGLDESRDYVVQVFASTRAGSGETSSQQIEKSLRDIGNNCNAAIFLFHCNSISIGSGGNDTVLGIVVGVVLPVVLVVVLVVIILIVMK